MNDPRGIAAADDRIKVRTRGDGAQPRFIVLAQDCQIADLSAIAITSATGAIRSILACCQAPRFPGMPPRVWNARPHNPHSTGRDTGAGTGASVAVGGLTVLVTMAYSVRELRRAEKADDNEGAE